MTENINSNPDNGNGKLKPPIVVQIVLDPNSGQVNVNSNVKSKKDLINLLATGIHIVNNTEESSIVIPQARIKL